MYPGSVRVYWTTLQRTNDSVYKKNTTLDRNRHDYSVVVLSLTAC